MDLTTNKLALLFFFCYHVNVFILHTFYSVMLALDVMLSHMEHAITLSFMHFHGSLVIYKYLFGYHDIFSPAMHYRRKLA